jgi:rifampin ADP-ribosylating transferase
MVGRDVPEGVMAALHEENLKVPARVWRDAFEGLLGAEPPLDTGRIFAPTVIVWGARDSLLPRADQEAMAAEMPGARLVIYADVGHLPVIEAPERVGVDLTAPSSATDPQPESTDPPRLIGSSRLGGPVMPVRGFARA